MSQEKAGRAAHRGDGGDPRKAVLLGSVQLSNSTIQKTPQATNGLHVELIYTRDRRVDWSDGAWSSHPHPPDSGGWLIWDTNPERKTGWLRILADRPRTLCFEGGHA